MTNFQMTAMPNRVEMAGWRLPPLTTRQAALTALRWPSGQPDGWLSPLRFGSIVSNGKAALSFASIRQAPAPWHRCG